MVLEGKLLFFQVLHEFVGCVMLGCFLNVARSSYWVNIYWPIFLLFFIAWLAYAFAYRVSGGHLNPAITFVHMC